MTDEERQKLCATLRWYGDRLERELSGPMRDAADEIERLVRERDETIKSSDVVCDSYAEENQRLSDKIERLTKKIAEAEAALRNTLLNYEISDVHSLTKPT